LTNLGIAADSLAIKTQKCASFLWDVYFLPKVRCFSNLIRSDPYPFPHNFFIGKDHLGFEIVTDCEIHFNALERVKKYLGIAVLEWGCARALDELFFLLTEEKFYFKHTTYLFKEY